ncbi:reverse transcriptase domain-containing protein [Tanacetum coccineum]
MTIVVSGSIYYARPKGVCGDVFVKLGGFTFPTDFVVVDFEADPRVPLILGRSFLRTGRALIDVYKGELILRNGDERLIFHVNKHPQKHENESIKMINFIDVSCEDSVGEVLRLKKSNHFLIGCVHSMKSAPLLDPFPPGNEDVDVEAELREIELFLNRDPSINFSPTITIDPNSERFIDEPAPACLPPPGDDDDDESFLKEDVQGRRKFRDGMEVSGSSAARVLISVILKNRKSLAWRHRAWLIHLFLLCCISNVSVEESLIMHRLFEFIVMGFCKSLDRKRIGRTV